MMFFSSETDLRVHHGEEDVRVGRKASRGRLPNCRRSSSAEDNVVARFEEAQA